jgi:ABC-2 type transport system ATP-binding protein
MTSTASNIAIHVQGLTKRFGPVLAVDGIDFDVVKGSITALLGGNGAGKTTTIAMILGLVEPSAGKIEILGERIPENYPRVLPRMNFESPYVDLPHRLTVAQNLNVFAMLYGVTGRRERIAELTSDLELTEFLHRPTGQLSAGQKTRVSLAKSLINAPEILLLDEPTASLDPDTADWVRGYLENYCATRGATILLASHNMAEVERMCDTVLMMRTGRIVDSGAPDALISRYGRSTMEEVFLDIARGTGKGAALINSPA